jgi:hypothetical protein
MPTNLDWQRLQWITSDAVDVVIRIFVFGTGSGSGDEVRMRETSGFAVGPFLGWPVLLSRKIWLPPLPLEEVDSRLEREK